MRKSLFALSALGLVIALAGPARADTATGDETLYEGFNYVDNGFWEPTRNTDAVDGVESGSGWSQNDWAQGTKNAVDSKVAWGQTYGVGTLALDTNAGGAGSGANLWGNRSRQFGTALDGMMDDGDTLWFSVIAVTDVGFGTEKLGFAIADGDFSGSNQENMGAGVSGIGIFSNNTGPAIPTLWSAGGKDVSLDSGTSPAINKGLGSGIMIVGKIEFGATDTLTIYTPDTAVDELGPADAVNSAAIDQSNFDRVAVLVKEGAYIDEIRVGSYAGAFGRIQGDADNDKDVDNADLGAAAGGFTGAGGSGGKWSTGDHDGDGDVDNADLGAAAGNFTGALAGNLTDSGSIADLIYNPATGNLKLDASEATGAVITSFQLENGTNGFVPGNYVGPTGGTFGGAFEDLGTNVIGDTDFTTVGFSGIVDLGNVAPTGMDLTGLEAFLTTAVYTGSFGSGQQVLDLVVVPEPASMALLGLGGLAFVRRRRG